MTVPEPGPPPAAGNDRRRLTAMRLSLGCGVGAGVLALVTERPWAAVAYATIAAVQLWRGVTLLTDRPSR